MSQAISRAIDVTKQSAYPFPRAIDPSLIEDGDTIRVALPKNRGLEATVTGTVDHRIDHGHTRYLYTAEGATLLAWEPKNPRRVNVLLLHRPEAEQTPLFEIDDIRERLAG